MTPSPETQTPQPLNAADWERWLAALPANEALIGPDRDSATDLNLDLAQEGLNLPPDSVIDARFLNRADLDANGAKTGYTLQYMELVHDEQNQVSGRILDVGHYDAEEHITEVVDQLQQSFAEGSLAPADLPILAAELARVNNLPGDDWREATPDDHQRFLEQNPTLDDPNRDVPPDALLSDPAFTDQLFRETAVAPGPAHLVNEQALTALNGIGLTIPPDFDLARDSIYDPGRSEHVINAIFQRDPADSSQNCRPLIISITPNDTGFAALGMEYGSIGGVSDVMADHDRVQAALEQGGMLAGLAAIEPEVTTPEPHRPSLEIS